MMEGMLELLSTTDAAVKALDKSSRSQSSTSSRGSGRQTDRDKTEPSHDSGIVRSEQKTHPSEPYQPAPGREVWDRSSDESTTASDVLIRSTLGDPHEKSLLEGKSVQEEAANDASSVSKCSRSSYGMDNFNSSGPQKVKISTKKLREIKSPYESPRDGVQITDGNGKPLNGAPEQLSAQRSQDSSARSSPLNSARSSQRSVGVDRSQNSVGSKHSSVAGSKHSSVAGSKHSSVAGSRPGSGGSSRHSISSRTSGALHQGGASIQPRSGTGSHPSSVGGSRPQSGGSQRPSGSRPSSGTSARSTGSRQGQSISVQEKMQTSVSSATVTNNPKDIITLQSTPQGKKTMSRVFPQANGIKGVDTHTHSPPVHDTDVDSAKPVFIERHTPLKKTSSAINHVDDDDDRFAFDMLQKKLDLSFDSGKQVSVSNENSIQSATSSQPEIVTVPERIVTVSARNSVSTDNSVSDVGSENVETIVEKVITISSQPPISDEVSSSGEQSESLDEKIPPALLDRFLHGNKNQGPSLKQGSQMDGVSAPDKKSSDIMVSDFKLSEKQRLIKESFAKRFEQGGPKKRVIQPKIIGHQRQSREVDTRQPSNVPNNQTTEAVTAAVAASAAIAVTQPFLKAQQELESKMANILGKIAELHSNKPEQPESGREQQKVSELENRLADLTEQRIKQLESQVAIQAQLLSMSRNPQDVQSIPLSQSRSRSPVIRSPSRSPPRSPPRSPQMQRKTEPPKTAVTKTKFMRPSQTGKRPDYDEWRKIHKADSETQLQSPLDTPNPRSRAPKPVAYEASKEKKSKGILEEILASDGSPRRDVPIPMAQERDAKSQLEPISPAVKKADDLVNELVDIKTEMNTVLADADIWKSIHDKKLKDLEYDKIKEAQLYGPSPLDPYLIQPSKELQSPYKPKVAVPLQLAKAPPISNFSDAREILREVRQTRACLEANLEAVQRSRREVEVYSVMENMYQESNAELDRIKKMVDKKVAIIRSQVEREVTDEVVHAEMNKNQPRIIPSSTAPPTMRGIGRGRVGARIDTGLSKIKGPSFGPPLVSKAVGKENVDSLRSAVTKPPPPKQPKLRSVFEDEDYMTRVYGKGSHQKGRSTVKNVPYLHYQNVPKTKAERPQAAPDTKNAHVVKSAKTQTGPFVKQFYFSPAHGAYFPVASSSAPIAGQLVPMAVPLGAPRIEGGLTQGVTIDTPSGPLTSTPASRPQVTAAGNVAMVSFAVEDDLETTPQPELSKQVLPAVDIETDISEVSPISSKTKTAAMSKKGAGTSKSPPSKELSRTTRSPSHMGSKSPDRRSKGERVESPSRNSERKSTGDVHFQSPQMSPSKRRLEDRDEAQGEEEDENTLTDVSEEDLPPEKAPGIELPGYHPPSPPPQPRPKEQDLPPRLAQMITQTMDVLDEDIQRRELLENKAVEWIEQELMSRIISDMPEINHPPPPRPRELAHEALDESQDSMAEEKEQSMFMMDCIGRAGLQIFVDAGQPVDAELVNALIKEVLEEKVSNMLGQRPDEEAQLGGQRSMPKLSAAPDADRIQEGRNIVEEEDDYRSHQIETPQPTPKYTPISSPERVISPPMTPPLSPVRTPHAAPVSLPEPVPVHVESEPESLSIDLSEELRNLKAKLSQPPLSTSPTREVHDVITPVPTPVPEPSPEPEPEPEVTRPITPPIPTPRQEVPVKVVEAAKPVSIPPPKVEVPQPVEKGSQTEAPSLPESPKSQVESPVSERKSAKLVEKHEEQPEMVDRPLSPIIIESPAVKTTSPPPSESEESVIESSISDTIGQSVSEGQWLLNKSEGEIADFPIDEVQKMKLMHTARQQAEISTASTMRGTEDIQDESTEFPISEGEFQYKPSIMPDKDPLLLLMSRFQHQPVQPGQFDMTTDQVADFLDHTGKSIGELSMHPMEKSMGEVSYVKPKRSKARQSPDRYQGRQSPDRYQGRQSPDRYQGRQSPDRYQGRGSRSPSPRKGRQSPEGQYNNNGRRSPGQGWQSPGQGRQSPGMGRMSPERDQYYRGESPTMDGYYQEREVDYGRKSPTRRRTNDRRSPSVSFEDEVNGRVSPQRTRSRDSPGRGRQSPGYEVEKVTIETTTTSRRHHHSPSGQGRPAGQGRRTPSKPSTPGGVSLGGSLTAGRTSPLKSSLRKPPLSQGVPEKSVTLSGTRTFNVRASDERYSQEDRLSMSDRGTHAFTPDQMNMEELLASGYLTQTFSDSQGANSLRSSRGSQGISPDRQRKKGKSLGLTYSFESEGSESYSMSELKRLAGSGSLGMSGTAETGEFGESFSYADNL